MSNNGVWATADTVNGLTGPALHLSSVSVETLTSAANQTLIYNVNGTLVLQAENGVRVTDGTIPVFSIAYNSGINAFEITGQSGAPARFQAVGGQTTHLTSDDNGSFLDATGTGVCSIRTTDSLLDRIKVWNGSTNGAAISIGLQTNNDSESEAAAGLTGPVLNITTISAGSLTSVASQATIHNSSGVLTAQGHAGFKAIVNTTQLISADSTTVTLGVAAGQMQIDNGGGLLWDQGVTAPHLRQNSRTSDAATNSLTVQAQSAFAGSTGTNRDGGHAILRGGAKDGAGVDGSAQLKNGAGTLLIEAADGSKLGFYGVTAVVRPTAYTQTYSTASRTHAAYTSDPESSAYTGAADGEAKLVDLNALRVAYENLRVAYESTSQVLNQLLDDLQANGLLQ